MCLNLWPLVRFFFFCRWKCWSGRIWLSKPLSPYFCAMFTCLYIWIRRADSVGQSKPKATIINLFALLFISFAYSIGNQLGKSFSKLCVFNDIINGSQLETDRNYRHHCILSAQPYSGRYAEYTQWNWVNVRVCIIWKKYFWLFIPGQSLDPIG